MNIPKDLLRDAIRLTGSTTQTMAVVLGLEELVRRKKIEALLKLKKSNALRLSIQDVRRMRSR